MKDFLLPPDFCVQCHADMKRQGFWDDWYGQDSAWGQPWSGLIVSRALLLIHTEIREAWADRSPEEWADVYLRCADLAGFKGWELPLDGEKGTICYTQEYWDSIIEASCRVSEMTEALRKGSEWNHLLSGLMAYSCGAAMHHFGTDLIPVILEKFEANKLREKKHGKLF